MPSLPADTPRPDRSLLRRIPWALVPFVFAGTYALGYGALRHRPALEAMVPSDAFVTWRWKDVAAYDRTRTPLSEADANPIVPASEVLGAELNVPGLPGVDRARSLLEVWLAPERRVDPRFFVLPVTDASALVARYRDPDLRERHARTLEVHGAWAASSWDRDAVRLAGRGEGLFPALLGETWCVAADWPKLVDFALQPDQAQGEPYRSALGALGFAPASQQTRVGETGTEVAVQGGRVPFVRDAWKTVTLWSFDDRVRAELVPSQDGDLDEVLAGLVASPSESGPRIERPEAVEASITMPDARARKAMALALWYAGLAWPLETRERGFGALHLDAPGALTVWAEMSPGALAAWTLLIAGPKASLPDLVAFGLPALGLSDGGLGAVAPLSAQTLPLTAPYGGEALGGELAREPLDRDGLELVAIGPFASTVAKRVRGSCSVTSAPLGAARGAKAGAGPHAMLATFHLSQLSAQRLLGAALGPRGLLFALASGAIDGEVWTDGRVLVLEASRVAR